MVGWHKYLNIVLFSFVTTRNVNSDIYSRARKICHLSPGLVERPSNKVK